AIDCELPHLRALAEAVSVIRPAGEQSWSPKEELGHLIDSASNNHMRFVGGALDTEYRGPGYAQNAWVYLHAYQRMQWDEIVSFWFAYNSLLVRLIAN